MSKYQFTITHWQQNSFRWAYLGQYLTYSFDFQYLDIICHALSKNEVQIWKFKKKKCKFHRLWHHTSPLYEAACTLLVQWCINLSELLIDCISPTREPSPLLLKCMHACFCGITPSPNKPVAWGLAGGWHWAAIHYGRIGDILLM